MDNARISLLIPASNNARSFPPKDTTCVLAVFFRSVSNALPRTRETSGGVDGSALTPF